MVRADAARNRRLLLDAASVEFAEHGMEVSIAQIAARAGVGKGTVFRHFDSKEQLVSAILCDQLDTLTETGNRLLPPEDGTPMPDSAGAPDGRSAPDSVEGALLAFMAAGVELQVADRSFCQAVAGMSRSDPGVRAASDRLSGVAEALTERARRAGVVRGDVTGYDIVLLLGAVSQAALPVGDAVPGLWRRYLGVVFDGLRPEGAHPLPVGPPTSADFTAAASPQGAPSP